MDDARTVWVGNLAEQVNEELLYELFLQAGPLVRVKIPTDREGRQSNFGFVTFKHEASVPYTVELLRGVQLFERGLNIKPRNGGVQNKQPNSVQRSISFPTDQNQHRRFDDYNMSPRPYPHGHPPHTSCDDLLRQGHMLNVNFDYTNDQEHFRDQERDRRDFGRQRDEHHRDRRHGRHDSRNHHKKNHDRRNNYERNRGKRDQKY